TDHLGHALLRIGVGSKALPVLYAAMALALGLAFTAWQNP
ncbi:MAG: undecaprenyl/decaprenyl-phosphate alpha-N-acetylglucosaminyl 1-phosphate transferase, partial [Mesorhizobium sp.]